MKTIKIPVNDKLVDYIESLQYEKDRTNEISAFMLSHGYDTHNPTFEQWDKDNQKAFVKLQKAKEELAKKYVNPRFKDKKVNWELNFDEKTIIVKVPDTETGNAKKD